MRQTQPWLLIGVLAASCGSPQTWEPTLEEGAVVGTRSEGLSSYSNCRGGCPEDMLCAGHYGQGYCLPLCNSHDECKTGCCSTTQGGNKVCSPLSACLGNCKWASKLNCVTDTQVVAPTCPGGRGISLTVTNACSVPVRPYTCITVAAGTFDCRHDQLPDGLPPGGSYTHTVCESGGRSLIWATDFETFEQFDCRNPLP